MIQFPLEKTVNPWNSFGSFHERKIQEKTTVAYSDQPTSPAGERSAVDKLPLTEI
jgi:hypothetical protein